MDEWVAATGETNVSMEQVKFVDPDRNIATYMKSIGETPTYEAFMEKALLQSRHGWNQKFTAAAVNAYIRAGFQRAKD